MRHGRAFPIQPHLARSDPAQGVYSAFNQARAAILAGFDAASSPANGWNDEVRDGTLEPQHVVRTSDTVATIGPLPATPDYNISAQEIVTGTIPASALVGAAEIEATPTFTVDVVAGGTTPKGVFDNVFAGPFGGPI